MEATSVDYAPRGQAPAKREAAKGPLGLFEQILNRPEEEAPVPAQPTTEQTAAERDPGNDTPPETREAPAPEAAEPPPDPEPVNGAELPAPPQEQQVVATVATAPAEAQAAVQAVKIQASTPDTGPATTQAKTLASGQVQNAGQASALSAPGGTDDALGAPNGTLAAAVNAKTANPANAAQQAAAAGGVANPANAAAPRPTPQAGTAQGLSKPGAQSAAKPTANGTTANGATAEKNGLPSETFAALARDAALGGTADPGNGDLQAVGTLRTAGATVGGLTGSGELAGTGRLAAELRGGPAQQVAVQIKRAVASGNDRINIRLHPAELGRVQVRLDLADDGHVKALVTVDRMETLDLMQRDLRGLERALQEAGLKTDSGSLSFNLQDQGGDTAGTESGSGEGSSGDAPDGQSNGAEGDPAQRLYWTGDDGRLDIRI